MTRSAQARQQGFTLIEIMVVVVIIGLLAAVATPMILNRVDDARIARAKMDIRAFDLALVQYRLDNARLPTTEQGLQALIAQPADPSITHWREGGYMQGNHLTKDPWGRDYQYQSPGDHGEYDIYSFGADGKSGGEKNDADIGNWNLDQ